MIRVVGSTGSDGKTIIWFFVIAYLGQTYVMTPMHKHMNRKGAVTFFYNMIQREKKAHEHSHSQHMGHPSQEA